MEQFFLGRSLSNLWVGLCLDWSFRVEQQSLE